MDPRASPEHPACSTQVDRGRHRLRVAGRNSDNTFIKEMLDWEPDTPLREGMEKTYAWIEGEYEDRKAGRLTPAGVL